MEHINVCKTFTVMKKSKQLNKLVGWFSSFVTLSMTAQRPVSVVKDLIAMIKQVYSYSKKYQ